jgi:hypothetical protein
MSQSDLHLHLDILPAAQRRLWDELVDVPSHFILYGGTALALRLGHRHSVDFDLFAFRNIDHAELIADIPFLSQATTLQQQHNTLSVLVDREGPVSVSFFGLPKLFALADAECASDNNLYVASLLDIAATKVSVVQVRAEAKDYLDIDALINLGGIDLATALVAASTLYGPSFNPQVTLKALSYFDDGNVTKIPESTKERLILAARSVDLGNLPVIPMKNRT